MSIPMGHRFAEALEKAGLIANKEDCLTVDIHIDSTGATLTAHYIGGEKLLKLLEPAPAFTIGTGGGGGARDDG